MGPSRFRELLAPLASTNSNTQTIILPIRGLASLRRMEYTKSDETKHKQAITHASVSVKEAIQAGASSGIVEPVRGILLCYNLAKNKTKTDN